MFAIAITLLVLDLKVPALPDDASAQAIGDALLAEAPSFFAFVLSFAVVGLYWLAHWRKFQLIVRANQRLLVLNLALLGSVAFIPFPTRLIAEFGESLTTAIYAISLAVTGLLGSAMLWYAWRAGLVDPAASSAAVRNYTVRGPRGARGLPGLARHPCRCSVHGPASSRGSRSRSRRPRSAVATAIAPSCLSES